MKHINIIFLGLCLATLFCLLNLLIDSEETEVEDEDKKDGQ